MAMPMSNTMRSRWRYHQHIAQAQGVSSSDYRPSARVFITRGHMRHFDTPLPTATRKKSSGRNRRGLWDEKYAWGGRPGEFLKRKPGQNKDGDGVLRSAENLGPTEIDHISNISITNSLGQNGIGTASVTLANAEWEELENSGFFYHVLREGFFGPTYFGDDIAFLFDEKDNFIGEDSPLELANSSFTSDGKRLSGLILPNRKIEIFQGYGDELQRTFVGLIDTVDIQTNPSQIVINASDFAKTTTIFGANPRYVDRYPVSFGDKAHWRERAERKKAKRSEFSQKLHIPNTITLVKDLTNIVGYLLGWSGFWDFKTIRAGRIGESLAKDLTGPRKHNAVFKGENFDKGTYFIDGINQLKEMLGYTFYVTPEWNPDRGGSARFQDPDVYAPIYSPYSVGMPYFTPHNIWTRQQDVEQVTEKDILINANLTYDLTDVRKNMYMTNSGLKNRKGRPRSLGWSSPHSLMSGVEQLLFLNIGEEYGKIQLEEDELRILVRMIGLVSMMQFAQGSITMPGYPGAMINDQIDLLDTVLGEWRRFFISGFSSNMELGANSSYSTTLNVNQIDNYVITRIKNQIEEITGKNFAANMRPKIKKTSQQ